MSEELRVIVCGGRYYEREDRVFAALEWIRKHHDGKLVVIEGGATGADAAAKKWAEDNSHRDVDHLPFPAEWKRYGNDAGRIRNQQMRDEDNPNAVISFPGGPGTRNMIRLARQAHIPIIFGEELLEGAVNG